MEGNELTGNEAHFMYDGNLIVPESGSIKGSYEEFDGAPFSLFANLSKGKFIRMYV